MQLLWRGIAGYVLPPQDRSDVRLRQPARHRPEALAVPLSYLYHHHLAPEAIRPRALPERYTEMNLLPAEAIDMRRRGRRLPPLIKGYLRLGGFVGDGAVIDRQFNTTDVCVIVQTDQITDKYYRHYDRTAARESMGSDDRATIHDPADRAPCGLVAALFWTLALARRLSPVPRPSCAVSLARSQRPLYWRGGRLHPAARRRRIGARHVELRVRAGSVRRQSCLLYRHRRARRVLDAAFVAKTEVESWPGIGLIAQLGRHRLRRPAAASSKRAARRDARASDRGARIADPVSGRHQQRRQSDRPFKSALFSVAEVTDRDGHPLPCSRCHRLYRASTACRSAAPGGPFSPGTATWIWPPISGRCSASASPRSRSIFHPPVTSLEQFNSRKALAEHCHRLICQGACRGQWRSPAEVTVRRLTAESFYYSLLDNVSSV